MNRYNYSDDNPVSEKYEKSTNYGASDGLEIALPENVETYRLLMGEDPESNPKVEAFREAYDRSMMETDDHAKCMEEGRKALVGMGKESMSAKCLGMGQMMSGMAGENPLNQTEG